MGASHLTADSITLHMGCRMHENMSPKENQTVGKHLKAKKTSSYRECFTFVDFNSTKIGFDALVPVAGNHSSTPKQGKRPNKAKWVMDTHKNKRTVRIKQGGPRKCLKYLN